MEGAQILSQSCERPDARSVEHADLQVFTLGCKEATAGQNYFLRRSCSMFHCVIFQLREP